MDLVIGENSYLTLEEAESIVSEELYSDSKEFILWGSLNDADKKKVCKNGTMAINSLQFIGQRNVWNNSLKFPRIIHGIEETPYVIKVAALMNGLMDKVTCSSENYTYINSGVSSITVGPNSIDFDINKYKSVSGARVYDDARLLIERYILKYL